MATFTIQAHTKVEVWQDVTYVVEAETIEEAKEKVKESPLSTAIGYDTMEDAGEKVLFIDFGNSGNGESYDVKE